MYGIITQRSNLTDLVRPKPKYFPELLTTEVKYFFKNCTPFKKILATFQFSLLGKGKKATPLLTIKVYTVPKMEMLAKLTKLAKWF